MFAEVLEVARPNTLSTKRLFNIKRLMLTVYSAYFQFGVMLVDW
jgi:hypothetical protein